MTPISGNVYTVDAVRTSPTLGSISVRSDEVPAGTAISKNIEVSHDGGASYFVTVADAKRLTSSSQAKWDGPKRIKLNSYTSKRGIWAVRGPAAFYCQGQAFGPKFGTLQLT